MIALTAPLPLRTTADWAGFRDAAVIPHRYGSTGGRLLQYDAGRRLWVWADHACLAVDSVLIGGQPVGNWRMRNGADSAGRTVCFVEFDQAVDEGVEPIARGRGKLHRVTGLLVTNPADVVDDILATIAGRPLADGRLDSFRAACAQAGLSVGGSIDEAVSARAAVRAVADSIGALWAPDAPAPLRLWPGGAATSARLTVDRRYGLQATCALADLVTDLTVRYQHEDGTPRAAVQLRAADAAGRYGTRPLVLDAPWLTDARVAVAVGLRLLAQRARPQWQCSVSGLRTALSVGDALTLDHPVLPLGGTHVVLGREWDIEQRLGSVSLSVPVGDAPAVRLVRTSAALDPQRYVSAAVEVQGTERVITIYDHDGRPIAGATVTLDGTITRIADAGGRVTFPASAMPPGVHVLAVVTPDGQRLEITVIV